MLIPSGKKNLAHGVTLNQSKKKRNHIEEIKNKNESIRSNEIILKTIFKRVDLLLGLEEFYKAFIKGDLSNGYDDDHRFNLEEYKPSISEGTQYIAVGLVACLESYFRTMTKILVDNHIFYRKNAASLTTNFDLSTAIDLEVNQLSVGDLVAHQIKLNNFDDINKNMTTIMGNDFCEEIKKWRKSLEQQQDLFTTSDSEKDSRLLQSIKDLFSYRNKVCHEAYISHGPRLQYSAPSYTGAIIEFMNITNTYINDHLNSRTESF